MTSDLDAAVEAAQADLVEFVGVYFTNPTEHARLTFHVDRWRAAVEARERARWEPLVQAAGKYKDWHRLDVTEWEKRYGRWVDVSFPDEIEAPFLDALEQLETQP